ncbi:hypothetical protein GEV33_006330 [Tenebrio molitor]|uniref:Reverse transcriptase domain-containing protein n=1 Tax=Tenebrio molitor TaxID=7067 RepID=A0A8J6HM16_TENMO|nr:hypothetical protein GEV33_006330 [Tenebrio molitor]
MCKTISPPAELHSVINDRLGRSGSRIVSPPARASIWEYQERCRRLETARSRFTWRGLGVPEGGNELREFETLDEGSLLSRDELTYELELRDSTVSEENSTDDLDVTPLSSPVITPEAEFANCSNGVEEIAKLVKAVITRQSIPLVQVKLWHYQRRVDAMAHTAQMYSEETGELKAQLEDVSKKFAAKAKFVRNPAPVKTREERQNASYEVVRVYEGGGRPNGNLNITKHEVMHGMKHLLTGKAREWYRLVEGDVRTWSDFCRKLRKEFLPRDYEETALQRLKQFKPSSDESATIFIARFNHRAHFLPTALSNERKLEILRRNIRPYYQEKLWDKDINTIQQLINYCDRLDDTRLNVEKFARGKAKTPNHEPERKRTTRTPKETGMHCETFGKRREEVTERRTLPPNGDTDDVFGATLNLMLSSFRGDDAIYMPVEVIGMKFYGMLDSGASHVIVNHEGCRKLKALGLESRENATTSCALAENTTLNRAGIIPTPFNVKGKCCIIDVLVIPSVRYELMLGREFWRKFGLLPNIRDLNVQSWDDLSAHHQQALQRAISHYFKATEGVELGRTSLIEHRIELKDGAKPVQFRNYRVSPYVQWEMDKEWKEMFRLGVIRRSESEWNSPPFMIPKKDGTRRFVVNYQKLNAISKRPAYPILNMTDILEKLGNARFITTLDIWSAY